MQSFRLGLMVVVAGTLVGAGTLGCGGGGKANDAGPTGAGGNTGGGTGGRSGGGTGGGAAGGSAGGFTTTVGGGKRLADLTSAEQTQLCDDLAAFLNATSKPGSCRLIAWGFAALEASLDPTVTNADLQSSCTTFTTACVAGEPLTTMCDPIMPTCTATVAEYSACVSDFPLFFETRPACSALTRAALLADGGTMEERPATPACMTLETKCPQMAAMASNLRMSARR